MKHMLWSKKFSWVAGLCCVCSVQTAQATIVFVASPSEQWMVGSQITYTPRVTCGQTPTSYAIERSQAWRLRENGAVFLASPYALGTPGCYGYPTATGRDRQTNTRWHVVRANAYRTGRFEKFER